MAMTVFIATSKAAIPPDLWYRAALKLIEGVADREQRADLRMTFEERAAICEYDGGLSRPDAERIAFNEIRKMIGEGAHKP